MSRYIVEIKNHTVRILLSSLFITLCFLGADAQVDVDSTIADKAAIIQYSLKQNDLSINDIEIDKNNRVIVSTSQMLLIISNANTGPMQYLEDEYISCAIAGKDDRVYAAGKNHLFLVSEGRKESITDPGVIINDIAYHANKLYLATNKGLYTYLLANNKWKVYTKDNSKLKSDQINFVKRDDDKVLWVGTSKGYVRIEGDKWELEDKKYNVLNSRNNKEGQWMVAQGDMWLIDPFNRKYDVGLNEELYRGEINDFVIDSKGRLYMASETLIRYNPYNEEIEKYGEDLKLLSQKCISLACDKNNNIWIGTENAGLFRILFDDIAQEQLAASILVTQDVGSYAVTVSDKFGSQFIAEVTLRQPSPITVSIGEVERVTGFNKRDGGAIASASGGSGQLSYRWSNNQTEPALTRAAPGKYTLRVSDENGCSTTAEVTIKKEKYIPELDIAKVEIGKALRINELSFDADSTNLRTENFEILDEVYDFLTLHKSVKVEIGGHTNTIPSHEYCDRLSTARAKSVAEYVISQGIDPARVSYKGYGKREPITKSESAAARKKNQRVEVKILSM